MQKKKNYYLNSIFNLFNIQCYKFFLHVTKSLYATYELEEHFANAAIEKNFQAAASKTNIRCKELSLITLRLQKISSRGNRIKFLYLRVLI